MANMQDYEDEDDDVQEPQDDSSMTEVQDSDIQKWLEVIRDEASEKGIDLSDEDKFTDLAIDVLDNDPKQISEDQVADIITKLKAACDECNGGDQDQDGEDTDDLDDTDGAASKAAKQMESITYSGLVLLTESEDVKEVCDEDGVHISEVVTFAGAVAVCKGTKWALRDDEKTFSAYKRQGKVYHVKVGRARYLMQPSTSTYVNKSDRAVPAAKLRELLDKYPKLKVAIKTKDLKESADMGRKSNVLVEQQLQQLRRFAGINESSCSYREMQEDETPREKTGAERDAERRAARFSSMDDDDIPAPATKKPRGAKPKPTQPDLNDDDQDDSDVVEYDDIPKFDEAEFEKYNQRGGNRKVAGHDENKNANYGYRVLHANPRMPRGMFIEHMVTAKGVAKNYAATLYQQIKKRRADGHVDMKTGLPNGLHRKSARDTFGESYMFFHPTNPDFVLVEDVTSGKYRWADVTEDLDPVLVENATSAINLVQYIQTHKNQKIVARQVADILIGG